MKLRPVTKLDKKSTVTSKKLRVTSCQQIVTPLPFFQFLANLEQSANRIPNTWSVKATCSLTRTYLTKTENRTKKKSKTALILML